MAVAISMGARMPRVISSQVVALIEAAFPRAPDDLKVYSGNV
jgi:hypothetical protein